MDVSSADQALCPLCAGLDLTLFHRDKKREYYLCSKCKMVSVPQRYWLSPEEEKAEYDLHTNNPDDPGYRAFLSRVIDPLGERLDTGCLGLDFGCGAGSPVPAMMFERGCQVELYDPYYYPDTFLQKEYGFIVAAEVAEHLRYPRQEFDMLVQMLRTGGYIGIMTKMVSSQQAFTSWHYIRDMTHICFYSEATFQFLAKQLGLDLEVLGTDVILMRKRGR